MHIQIHIWPCPRRQSKHWLSNPSSVSSIISSTITVSLTVPDASSSSDTCGEGGEAAHGSLPPLIRLPPPRPWFPTSAGDQDESLSKTTGRGIAVEDDGKTNRCRSPQMKREVSLSSLPVSLSNLPRQPPCQPPCQPPSLAPSRTTTVGGFTKNLLVWAICLLDTLRLLHGLHNGMWHANLQAWAACEGYSPYQQFYSGLTGKLKCKMSNEIKHES